MDKTYSAKKEDIKRACYIVDASNKILGRLSTRVATILRGKHKAIYTPNIDTGDMVVVINADKIRVTGNKLKDKIYYRFSGYPGGQKAVPLEVLLKKKPTEVIKLAVRRMLPRSPLGMKMFKKLKVYSGETQPHKSQNPIKLEV